MTFSSQFFTQFLTLILSLVCFVPFANSRLGSALMGPIGSSPNDFGPPTMAPSSKFSVSHHSEIESDEGADIFIDMAINMHLMNSTNCSFDYKLPELVSDYKMIFGKGEHEFSIEAIPQWSSEENDVVEYVFLEKNKTKSNREIAGTILQNYEEKLAKLKLKTIN